MAPGLTATNRYPSAEEATETQFVSGALAFVQFEPESFEVYIGPGHATATNLFPSAEEATEVQWLLGALVGAQVIPELVEV